MLSGGSYACTKSCARIILERPMTVCSKSVEKHSSKSHEFGANYVLLENSQISV